MNYWNSTIKIKPCKKCGRVHDLSFVCEPKKQTHSRSGKIKRVSKKHSANLYEYQKVRARFLEINKTCQVKSGVCIARPTEVHHSRGRIGKFLCDESTFVATCSACHRWLEHTTEGIKWGKENGFIKTRVC